jgi:N-acetylglucosamine-6-phosphate deacetylase
VRLRARHYATGQPVDVVIAKGTIVSIAAAGVSPADHEAEWIAPAFFDLQINGCHGISFNSPNLTVEDVGRVVEECGRHGIAGLLPTLVTNSFEAIAHGFRTLQQARESHPTLAERLPGFHLEGPYIASEDGPRGAHPKEHVRPADFDEFRRWQEAAIGHIRLVTLAPEVAGALPFIEQATASGVVVAIGHTAASPAQIRDAIKAGAKLSTHLGNGSHAMLPRHDNYLWEQLASDELWASLIPDGHHLPAAVVKSFVRGKTPQRIIITCDASSLAGLPPGRYSEWGSEFEVLANGKVIIPGTPFLAGSGVFTDTCVATIMKQASVSLAEACDMASQHPRELLGLPAWKLEVGCQTPLLLFDWKPGGPWVTKNLLA